MKRTLIIIFQSLVSWQMQYLPEVFSRRQSSQREAEGSRTGRWGSGGIIREKAQLTGLGFLWEGWTGRTWTWTSLASQNPSWISARIGQQRGPGQRVESESSAKTPQIVANLNVYRVVFPGLVW